jgi:hypothetical protein
MNHQAQQLGHLGLESVRLRGGPGVAAHGVLLLED